MSTIETKWGNGVIEMKASLRTDSDPACFKVRHIELVCVVHGHPTATNPSSPYLWENVLHRFLHHSAHQSLFRSSLFSRLETVHSSHTSRCLVWVDPNQCWHGGTVFSAKGKKKKNSTKQHQLCVKRRETKIEKRWDTDSAPSFRWWVWSFPLGSVVFPLSLKCFFFVSLVHTLFVSLALSLRHIVMCMHHAIFCLYWSSVYFSATACLFFVLNLFSFPSDLRSPL